MKKLVMTALFSFAWALSAPSRAQIPVTDVASLTQQIQQVLAWAQQYTQMVHQIRNQMQQIDQLRDTYNSMTGSRGVGAFINGVGDQSARRYLPTDLAQIYDFYNGTIVPEFGALTSRISALRSIISTLPPSYFPAGSQLEAELNKALDSIAAQRSIAEVAYKNAADRIPNIEAMMNRINTTSDPKEIAELQARLSGEQALIQNEANRIAVLKNQQEIATYEQEQRSRERMARSAGGIGGIDFSSIIPFR